MNTRIIARVGLVALLGPLGCEGPEAVEETQQALGSLQDVGVIPNGTSCPYGVFKAEAYMDTEDSYPTTNWSGWSGGWYPYGTLEAPSNGYRGGVQMVTCRVPGSKFKPLTTNPGDSGKFYAVLQLGASCPAGSESFTRRFDNEDDRNNNTVFSDFDPSLITRLEHGASYLRFCLFRSGSDTMPEFPDVGFAYGVFGNGNLPGVRATGWIYTDDEDDNNGNNFYAASTTSEFYAKQIIEPVGGGTNTVIHMARVR